MYLILIFNKCIDFYYVYFNTFLNNNNNNNKLCQFKIKYDFF